MLNTDYKNSISFNARLGKNLKVFLTQEEFCQNKEKTKDFERLFHDTFEKFIDNNTVLERNNYGKFYLYNLGLKGVKVPIKIYEKEGQSLAQRLLNKCYVAYSRAEYVLFQKYISSHILKGQSLEEIKMVGENMLDKKRKPYFLDLIETSSRILRENPNSKLTELDYSNMINIQIQEIVNTATFQKLIKSFGLNK